MMRDGQRKEERRITLEFVGLVRCLPLVEMMLPRRAAKQGKKEKQIKKVNIAKYLIVMLFDIVFLNQSICRERRWAFVIVFTDSRARRVKTAG